VGFHVVRVVSADAPADPGEMSASETTLENDVLKVELDANGDLAQVTDKASGDTWLSAPAGVALFDDLSFVWPAWEIVWANVSKPPREVLAAPTSVRVVENGPVRVAVEVTRTASGSTFVQRYQLAAGSRRVEVQTALDWRSKRTFAKAVFPLATPNPQATYDLGLGVIQRGNDTPELYEVPAQQWADLTAPDGGRGVAVLSEGKFGWDKPDDGTLRLTLVHTAIAPEFHHDTNDLGHHRFAYALYGHAGDWRQGVVQQAAAFNQPLMAFQTTAHDGSYAYGLSALGVNPNVAVMALKRAEDDPTKWVLRVREAAGRQVLGEQVLLHHYSPSGAQASVIDGSEQATGAPTLTLNGVALEPFEPRTFLLGPPEPGLTALTPPESRPVELPYDTDVASRNDAREDGAFDDSGIALAAELLPDEVVHRGIRYAMGSTEEGALNAVACRGQEIALDPQPGDRLYLLAAADTGVTVAFRVEGQSVDVHVQAFTGFVGQWDSRVMPDGKIEVDPAKYTPAFVRPAEVGWYGAHRHVAGQDEPYVFTYLFRHVLPIPPGATSLTLPNDPRVKVMAVTLAADPNDDTVAASVLYDGFDPLAYPMVTGYAEILPGPDTAEGADAADDDADVIDVVQGDSGGGDGGGGCRATRRVDGGAGAAALLALLLVVSWVRRRRGASIATGLAPTTERPSGPSRPWTR
jgi:alpha-mannosidase